jgi:hypothetical protein
MRERSILQSVFALGLRHIALAVLVAVAIATGLFFWARHLPVTYTASALLSVDSPASRAPAPAASALAAAEGILRSPQFAVLSERLHLNLARDSATSRSHPQTSLTQPSPATLRITVTGADRKAVTVAANAVASLMAAWVPLQSPAPAPIAAPVPAPAPPVPMATQPPPPKPPASETQPDDLAQLRSELSSRQAALELQFDRLNRRLNTLAEQRLKLEQKPDTASSPNLAAISRQESQLRTARAHLLRQLDENDSTSDVLRARAAAAARQTHKVSPASAGSALPSSATHETAPPSIPAAPPSPAPPQQITPDTEAANVSFTIVALASQAQPVVNKRKQRLEGSAIAAGLVFGMLYLTFALWLYRPVAGTATLEELLPAQVIFLGVIPPPPAIPDRSLS